MQLLAVTIGLYVAQLLFQGLTEWLWLPSDWWRRPWEAYRLLTYGFAHDPDDLKHILFNMLVLGMFGRPVEQRYGRGPFIVFYLGAIVFAGLAWSLLTSLSGFPGVVFGASGGVSALFVLFALNFPRQEVLMMFFFPMPAWVAALIFVLLDVYGAAARSAPIAFTAHLAGALFGLYYYAMGFTHGAWAARKLAGVSLRPKPRLRVHAPDDEGEDDLSVKVDAILQKIQEQGQDSLTWNERRLLEKASRKYQQRRK
jgi:membrane associated rhomboid family serine protease